jgi:predicted small secreted protein
MKRIFLWMFFLALSLFASGCSTIPYTFGGFGAGIAKDAKDTWHAVDKADKWVEEKLW